MEFYRLLSPARALLGWTLSDLSGRSGAVSPSNLTNIENGKQKPREDTIRALRATLESEGIEFLPDGVRLREDGISMITGDDCYLRLLDDVHDTLDRTDDDTDRELLIWCANDKVSAPAVNEKYRALRKDGIKMRQLVQEGDNYLMGPLEEYRTIPKKHFVNVVKLTYGSKHATVNGQQSRILIHRDKKSAQSHRAVFNLLWEKLEQPEGSIANERF